MTYLITILACLALLTPCLAGQEKRLQTGQKFEGEEILNLSYSIGEHPPYAFQPLTFFQDTPNSANIPGCPMVVVNDAAMEVVLTFGQEDCSSNRALRNGKLILRYFSDTIQATDSTLHLSQKVGVRYDDSWVRGVKIEGRRLLTQVHTLSADYALLDSLSDLMILDANRSSSKFNGVMLHQAVVENDSLLRFTTTGAGTGRNLAGRSFTMEVNEPKRFTASCFQAGFQVPESGQETWVIERTASPDVIHKVIYVKAEDCNHTAQFQLYDGNELLKKQ